ncbi:unnamed protein product [Mytilus edulis]|uniref:Uncharacterized protein n=1 Tax=Mytilus edulis TaxID=6550 RepID=A0A8S3QW28_MYTED|nr:unnamed protein product [Mytilus edulis]
MTQHATELQMYVGLKESEKTTTQAANYIEDLKSGVASDSQMLVITSTEKSTLVNLSDESHTILEEVKANCVALFKGNIYGTITYSNKVCCYKSTGEPLWTFMHQDINHIGGIALDKNGFVYIVSRGNNSIVVVSPDGKISKTILSKADGINKPCTIDINRETGMMILSSNIWMILMV